MNLTAVICIILVSGSVATLMYRDHEKFMKNLILQIRHNPDVPIDPYHVGARVIPLPANMHYFIPLVGEIRFSQIDITGMSSIRRNGRSIIQIECGTASVKTRMAMGPLNLRSTGVVFVNGILSPTLYFNTDVRMAEIETHLEITNQIPTIVDYKLKAIHDITVQVDGLGIFNWAATFVANSITQSMKDEFRIILEGHIREITEREARKARLDLGSAGCDYE